MKTPKSSKISYLNQEIPEEIIFVGILPRIPFINSLLKFKRVSKSWCRLISSKKFAKTQLEYSTHNHNAIMISSSNRSNFAINHCPVDTLSTQDVVQFEFCYETFPGSKRIIGSCNGLCCIFTGQQEFTLLNPSTRKSYKLPPAWEWDPPAWEWDPRETVLDSIVMEGFGYDESTDDYKVLAVHLEVTYPTFKYIFRLYSLKTDSWKTVNDFIQNPSSHKSTGVLVIGKLHWLGKAKHDNCLEIISFDLGSEAAGVVEQPSFVDGFGRLRPYPHLGVLEGCLCILYCDAYNSTLVIWVMKEYGVKESWSRVLTVPVLSFPCVVRYDPPIPLCISEDNEFLVKHGAKLFTCNPETNYVKPLEINLKGIWDIGIYTQSLVSPLPCDR